MGSRLEGPRTLSVGFFCCFSTPVVYAFWRRGPDSVAINLPDAVR